MPRLDRRQLLATALSAGALPLIGAPGIAQSRSDTIRCVSAGVINSLDPVAFGATRETTYFSMNFYDRLLTFGRKPSDIGWIFDFDDVKGELAESFEPSADGKTIRFKLKPNATFHDGAPVTAADVKWSLDRAVSAGTMAKSQIATGSLTSTDQFKIIDARTIDVLLPQPDRLATANLAIAMATIFNSELARKHATDADPWALAWLKENAAGSGAYMIESFTPGQQLTLRRNENWVGGTKPFFSRAIFQTVPESSLRLNVLNRGSADLSIDLSANDVLAAKEAGKLKVISTPQLSGFTTLAFNLREAPFDKLAVREAIAAALPYEAIFQAGTRGLGGRLFDASWSASAGPQSPNYPQPLPFRTDLDKAKSKLAEAGLAGGFKTSISYGVSNAAYGDPVSALIKEALGRIGIEVEIRKLQDPQMAQSITEKKLPMLLETSVAMFPSTDYFFRIFLSGDQRWNLSNWANPEVDALLAKARFETDPAAYREMAEKLVQHVATDIPMILLWQPAQNAVMDPSVDGFTYWYHRQIDLRDLRRV